MPTIITVAGLASTNFGLALRRSISSAFVIGYLVSSALQPLVSIRKPLGDALAATS
jgi:hypothetical protein